MKRWIFALMLVSGFAISGTAVADPPSNTNESSKIVERLDVILKRLDAIEQRLMQLETRNPVIRGLVG